MLFTRFLVALKAGLIGELAYRCLHLGGSSALRQRLNK